MWRFRTHRVKWRATQAAYHLRNYHAEPVSPFHTIRSLRRLHTYLHETDIIQRHEHEVPLKRWPA